MTLFLVLILIALLLIPVLLERTRTRMDEDARSNAPGQFAKLPKGVTHYNWFGPVRGPVLVCIHGLTTPSFVWSGMVKGLALMGFRVLTYDLYGRGFSDRPKGPQDAAFFLEQLDALLEHEGVGDNLTVMGYSMGGAIATLFAARDPARVRHLVLLAPAGMGVKAGPLVNFIARTPIVGDWLMLAFYPDQLRRGIHAEGLAFPDASHVHERQRDELRHRGFVPAVLASLRGLLGQPLKAEHTRLHAAGVPVLAIWGKEDTVIPASAIGTLTEWSRNTVHEVIEDAGHGLTYTHADRVLELLRANVLRGGAN